LGDRCGAGLARALADFFEDLAFVEVLEFVELAFKGSPAALAVFLLVLFWTAIALGRACRG
jgi:hypothetical protein